MVTLLGFQPEEGLPGAAGTAAEGEDRSWGAKQFTEKWCRGSPVSWQPAFCPLSQHMPGTLAFRAGLHSACFLD